MFVRAVLIGTVFCISDKDGFLETFLIRVSIFFFITPTTPITFLELWLPILLPDPYILKVYKSFWLKCFIRRDDHTYEIGFMFSFLNIL